MNRFKHKIAGILVAASAFISFAATAQVPIQGVEMPQVRRLASDIYVTATDIMWELERGAPISRGFFRGSYRQLWREAARIRDEALSFQSAAHSTAFAHQI